MKRLIAGLMTALMVLIPLVSAFSAPTPCPIALDIKTIPDRAAAGLIVSLRYDGKQIAMASVNPYNEVMFDVGHLSLGCGVFEAVILDCSDNPACHKMVSFNPEGYTVWDITAVEVPCPICSDPVVCEECPIWTDCPTTTTTICEQCEVAETDWLAFGIVVVLGIFGGGFALTVKDGRAKLDKKDIEKLGDKIPGGCGIKVWKGYPTSTNPKGKLYFTHLHRSPKSWHKQPDRHKEGYDHNGEENLFPDFK